MTLHAPIRMLTLECDGDDGLIVTFSDGTSAGYVVDELLDLRPKREPNTYPPDSSRIHLVYGIASMVSKQKDPSDHKMRHTDDNVEAFFHAMYADGKLDDEHMAAAAKRIPGFRLPKGRPRPNPAVSSSLTIRRTDAQ